MNGPAFLYAPLAAYAAASVLAIVRRVRLQPGSAGTSTIIASALGIALQLVFVLARTIATGFLPFASRFEALALYALAMQLAGLVVYLATRQATVKATTDGVSMVLLVAALMPVGFDPGGGLNPILNSPWFAFHILAAFAGYGCFTAGLAWSIVHLFDRRLDLNPNAPTRLALSGLFLLGSGILTGAMWADSSWGAYWSWDPKESWALLTWSIFLWYVHWGSRRPKRAWSLLCYGLGFLTMMFTFIGINLLKWGMHRY